MCATNLRAGAALICAALAAEGNTEVSGIHHIERGYMNIVDKLAAIGADIYRAPSPEDVLEESEKASLQPAVLLQQLEQRGQPPIRAFAKYSLRWRKQANTNTEPNALLLCILIL